jgi:hypothetical protein
VNWKYLFYTEPRPADQIVKVCPLCAEPIKAAAKVCPFCRASQTRLALWGPHLGVGFSACLMLACVGLACYWLFPDVFHPEGRKFAPDRAQLVVARTSLERDQKRPEYWLNGYITNTGNYPWRVEELEVRFTEGEGKLVDVCHPEVTEKFVVQPHQEQAFRVGLGALAHTNSGIAAKVRVQAATDGNFPPKPNSPPP